MHASSCVHSEPRGDQVWRGPAPFSRGPGAATRQGPGGDAAWHGARTGWRGRSDEPGPGVFSPVTLNSVPTQFLEGHDSCCLQRTEGRVKEHQEEADRRRTKYSLKPSACVLQKISVLREKSWRVRLDERKLKKHSNQTQCVNFDGILLRDKNAVKVMPWDDGKIECRLDVK